MKVKIIFVIVCTIFQFSQIAIADLVPKYIEEAVKFCENNGHKYLKIVENQKNKFMMKKGKSANVELLQNVSITFCTTIGFNHNLRIRIVNTEAFIGTMDTILFNLINKKFFELKELERIQKHKRQKSIVLINSYQLKDFQAMSFFHNSLFYLLTFEFPSTFTWYTVMTFQDSSQIIMNKILFDENGLAIEDYNLHGYEISTASMDWMPFNSHKNCNPKGHKCQDNSGLLVDQMNYWAKRYNFTWDVMTAYGNDWGIVSKIR